MASTIEIIAKFINEASAGLSKLGEDVDKTTEKTDKSKESTEGWSDALLKNALAGVTVGAAFTAVASGIKATIDAYGEAEVVGAQLDAVLQSTGSAAGMTREELDSLADSLSKMSGVDDEVIARGEAVLLTFTKIGKDVFPAATEAALNMSAALGQDLQSSMIQVGKALNSPIEGASALRRVGVQLTDQQEAQIKAFMEVNDIASAQGVILNELAVEFGGVAEAMGNTTVGATNKLKTAWGNLMETMGENNAGIYRAVVEGFTGIVEAMDEAAQRRDAYQEGIQKANELELIYGGNMALTRAEMNMYGDRLREVSDEYARAVQYSTAWSNALQVEQETVAGVSSTMDEYVPKWDQLLGISTRISTETDNYNDKQTELMAKQAEVKAQIDELISLGWNPMSETVQDLQTKYDDLGLKSQDLAAKHAEAMGKMQYDLLITKLSADGMTDAEYKIAQQAGIMYGVFDSKSAESAKNMDLVTQAVVDGKLKVEDMKRALDLLPQHKDIDVVLNILTTGFATYGNGYSYATGDLQHQNNGYAEGGISTGPTSGHMELLHGTEAVIPLENGSIPVQLSGAGGMGGGNIYNVQVTIASPLTIVDEQSIDSVLTPAIERGIRQLQAQGVMQ